MKKLESIFIILFMVCTLQACQNNPTQTGTNELDTSNTPDANELDTSNSADTSSTFTVNLAVDKSDSDFAVDAANSNIAEMELGKLAIKNGKSKQVKNYGLMMIKDRSKTNAKLMAISQAKNLHLSTTLDTGARKIFFSLSQKTGDAFDKAYISIMITDHAADVKKFTDATKDVQDPDLKKYAIKTLPVLQKHLDAINAIHDSMGQ